MKFKRKERGGRKGFVLPLTCAGDGSWWPKSREEEGNDSLLHGWQIEATVSQIANDLGHERAWNLREKKEDDEGVPF